VEIIGWKNKEEAKLVILDAVKFYKGKFKKSQQIKNREEHRTNI
jgi:hypothetical protein